MSDYLAVLTQAGIDLVKHKATRKKRVFSEIIRPMMEELLVVHQDYLEMLERARQAFGEQEGPDLAQIRSVESWFSERRRAKDEIRRRLASMSHAFQASPRLPKGFRAFVDIVSDYFGAAHEGRRRHKGTVSAGIAAKLESYRTSVEQGKDPGEKFYDLIEACDEALDGIRITLAEAMEEYSGLRLEVA